MLSELHVPFLWGNFFLLAPKGIVIMMGVFSFSKNWVIARRFLKGELYSLELAYLCHFVQVHAYICKNFMLNTLKIQISFREVNVKHSLALFHRLPYIGITKDNIFLRLIILNSIKTTPVEVVVQSSIDKWFRRPTTFLRTFH